MIIPIIQGEEEIENEIEVSGLDTASNAIFLHGINSVKFNKIQQILSRLPLKVPLDISDEVKLINFLKGEIK